MKYFVLGRTYVIRIDPGEKIIEKLTELCRRDEIRSGWFSGIGAVASAEIGFYDPVTKRYEKQIISEPSELVSLLGNISLKDNKPYVHAHAALADRNLMVRGGHLTEGVVSVSCEVILTITNDKLLRKLDQDTGFYYLDLMP